jgi:two-component system nitrate/nitrite response regulator NarL
MRLILADSHAMLRTGVRVLLQGEPQLEIVEAADAHELLEHAAQAPAPSAALIDLDLPPQGATAAVSCLRDYSVAPVVWSHGSRLTPDVVYEVVRSGAVGVLRKEIAPSGLVRSLRTIANGQAPLSRDLAALLVARIHSLDSQMLAATQVAALSSREQQVLALIADGRSNKMIAAELSISESTAKRHVQTVLNKFSLHNRRDAAERFRAALQATVATDPAETNAP